MKHARVHITLFLLLLQLTLSAQESVSWEELWQDMVAEEDISEDAYDDACERLSQLASKPIDLNRATREELEELPFLSSLQVMDIQEYVRRYGPVRSLRELKMIPSLDYRQQSLLSFFVCVSDSIPASSAADSSRFHSPSHAEVTITGRVPFYKRQGDREGYLGHPYRHSFRAEYSMGDWLKAGLTGAQDAGEPFFANENKWGYDSYSYYVEVDRIGIVDRAIVGKFRVSAGMGLVFGSSFTLGRLASMTSLGRQPTTLRPNASRSQSDYFRGAAVTLGLLRRNGRADAPLSLTVFASHRPMDATLDSDSAVTTLVTTGYHRTAAEMGRKDNTHLTAFGGRLAFRSGRWRAGLNAVNTHTDRELRPSAVLYHRYSPSGNDFFNASLDYGYLIPRLSVSGETAVSGKGAVATVNSIGWQPTSQATIMALWRFYSYRYTGLYSHSFGDNASAQNEQGFFLGTTFTPLRRLTVTAYADYAWFPWARYLVSQSSRAWDFLLQAEYRPGRWQLQARGRVRLRQRDDETKKALTDNNEYRVRLTATYMTPSGWTARTQLDAVRAFYLKASRGWMVSENVMYQKKSWLLCATAAGFHTDDYASRLYLYERQMAHEFYMPSYYGQGVHLALMARKDICKRLRLSARLGYTNYFDRPAIGTGLQQIDGSYQTDLDMQLRWIL